MDELDKKVLDGFSTLSPEDKAFVMDFIEEILTNQSED